MRTEAENMSGQLRVLYVALVPSHHIKANNRLQFPVPGYAVPFPGLCLHSYGAPIRQQSRQNTH